jgi:hypothetical protein
VVGEYSALCDLEGYDTVDIVDSLIDCVGRSFEMDQTRCYIISALMKIVAHSSDPGVQSHGGIKEVLRK